MNGSEPAFPYPTVINPTTGCVEERGTSGMSTRLVVATKIMASYLVDPTEGSLIDPNYVDTKGVRLADKIAAYSLTFADALIAACGEKPNAQ